MSLLAGLVLAGDAQACTCSAEPIEEALDRSDAAFVGRMVAEVVRNPGGGPQQWVTFEIDQRVKGDLPETLVVRGADGNCRLPYEKDRVVGVLLHRRPNGVLLAGICSMVEPGELVAAGGEPRGTVIKVGVGLVFLGLVLAWAFRRKARGARPDLPGAPEP